MIKIYVDAETFPVKDEVTRVTERHRLNVIMVSNQWMRLPQSKLVGSVVVEEGLDKADDWIADRVGSRDVAV